MVEFKDSLVSDRSNLNACDRPPSRSLLSVLRKAVVAPIHLSKRSGGGTRNRGPRIPTNASFANAWYLVLPYYLSCYRGSYCCTRSLGTSPSLGLAFAFRVQYRPASSLRSVLAQIAIQIFPWATSCTVPAVFFRTYSSLGVYLKLVPIQHPAL